MKSFKQFINEATLKIKDRTINITKPSRATKDKIVMVNVAVFDKAFAKSEMYIGKKGKGSIKGRYERFGTFIIGGTEDIGGGIEIDYDPADSMEVSEVSVNESGEISFTNGRHRYAWLRDQGLKKIPVALSKESIENAKKYKYI